MRGVISASEPTFTPRYSELELKSTLPGRLVMLPSDTWKIPSATVTEGCVSVHTAVPPLLAV